MKTKLAIIIAIHALLFQSAFGQIDYTPYPGNTTYCSGLLETFTSSVATTGCGTRTWSITNGKFRDPLTLAYVTTITGNTADVRWDNVASTGTLTVTVTCGEVTHTQSKNFAIRSLAGRTLANPRANQTLLYCGTATVNLAVDVMFLLNTGGTTGTTQQRADGYEWTLPTGWNFSGGPSSEFVNIYPDNGCRGGTVKVKAYVDGGCTSGRSYSNEASINVNRPTPSISITPQAGYGGPSCGSCQPVIFTVNHNISCVAANNGFLWVFPSGWLTSPVFTNGNSITVTPSGGANDGGPINVTVNLSCGTSLSATPLQLVFAPPVISVSSPVCSGGSNVTLSNVPPTISVTWSGGSNMTVFSGQGTSSAVIKANSTGSLGNGTISASVSCANTTVAPQTVWVGVPNQIADILKGSGAIAIGATVPFSIHDPSNMSTGSVTYDWDVSGGYFQWIDTYAWTTITEPYLVLYAGSRNVCGSLGMTSRGWNIDNPGGCPPGEICEMSVYPNPSSDELTVSLTSTDTKRTITNVKLVDSNGTVVYSDTAGKNAKDIRIPVKDLKNGTYYLSIIQGRTIKQQQIIIRH